MGFLDKAKKLAERAGPLLDKAAPHARTAVDKAGEQIDKRTGGKYHDKIEQAGQVVVDYADERMAADGTDVRRHSDCKATCTYPIPSPDGLLVAHRKTLPTTGANWAQEPVQRNSEVFVTRLDGSGSTNVTNNPAYDGWPSWSPNGR